MEMATWINWNWKLPICFLCFLVCIYTLVVFRYEENIQTASPIMRLLQGTTNAESLYQNVSINTERSLHAVNIGLYTQSKRQNITANNRQVRNVTTGVPKRTLNCFTLAWGNFSTVIQSAWSKKCSFITPASIIGRTGNQMFQIATIIGLAHRYDLIPLIQNVKPVGSTFDLPNVSDMKLSKTSLLGTGSCCHYSTHVDKINPNVNWTLSGYLQSFLYFNEAKDEIKKTFKFFQKPFNDAQGFIKSISKPGVQNVCIHVRRGDFTSQKLTKLGYGTADISYIHNATSYFKSLTPNLQFIVLSDNIKWCKENIKQNGTVINFSPFKDASQDLALMSLCDDVIVTSGSFGWWGAWMAGGRTVYYKGYPTPGSNVAREFVLPEYYPQDWTGLT